jgi:hypothetical protein
MDEGSRIYRPRCNLPMHTWLGKESIAIIPSPQNRANPSPSIRLKSSTCSRRGAGAVKLARAVGTDEPQVGGIVRAPILRGHHMVDVERLAIVESLVTAGEQPLLAPGESPMAIRRRSGFRVPLSPVVLKGRVSGGIGPGDQPKSHHPYPGEFPEGGMAFLIHEDPAVLPGSHGPAPVFLGSPPGRPGTARPRAHGRQQYHPQR